MKGGFSGRVLMRTIGGGHEIPWPEPLTDNGFVLHKDYRMNGFSLTPGGKPWYEVQDKTYLAWLADYLPRHLPPLTTEQQRLADDHAQSGRLSGARIGGIAGWYASDGVVRPTTVFPPDFAEAGDIESARTGEGGYTYEEYVEYYQDVLEPDEPLLTREEWFLDEFGWLLAKEEDERRFALYWPDFIRLDEANIVFGRNTLRHEPPDAGWRIYLALVLRVIPDQAARIKELKDFYYHWHEMAD
ncbi:MAG: hypothetical protein A2505_06245 [Deltaproteobacteria bacterium RIFOXYD12_FULL_55_16]|nr:MAG: hypothetical protein A2505_06245 [Deltaproteobacteria bacterium RIFOXYD12_FULL_55_16]